MSDTIYESYAVDDSASFVFSNEAAGNGYWIAQTFTPSISHSITSVKLKLSRNNTPGTITVSIRATSGDVPTGADLTSGTTNGDTLTTDAGTGEWREITVTPFILVASTKYAIVMRAANDVPTNYAGARGGGSGYSNGNECYDGADDGATWFGTIGADLVFYEYGIPLPGEGIGALFVYRTTLHYVSHTGVEYAIQGTPA